MGHGMAAQRTDTGRAHWLGETGHVEPGPLPQLAVCPSVRPPVHQNPEERWSWVPTGQGWTPHTRIGLTQLEVSSGSLKGSRLGSARQQALSPEYGQGPRPLCPCLGHRDPSTRGVVGAGLATTSGHGCNPHRRSPSPLKAQLRKQGHQTDLRPVALGLTAPRGADKRMDRWGTGDTDVWKRGSHSC